MKPPRPPKTAAPSVAKLDKLLDALESDKTTVAAKGKGRKGVTKVQAAPVAKVKAKTGAKIPSAKVAATIALARRLEGVGSKEITELMALERARLPRPY